ncbi:MAG TPA: phosphate propanoyltransferase [Bacilli bacterium]
MQDDELIQLITREVVKEILKLSESGNIGAEIPDQIRVGVSARHLHVTKDALEALFGAGYQLTKRNDLSMRKEFAANETVTLVGANGRKLERVRILGPLRSVCQIELSATDARYLGLAPPVRESGNVAGSAPITLVGPKGTLRLSEGCIIANRHIHFSPAEAKRYQVAHNQKVDVLVEHSAKPAILLDVQVRVKDTYTVEMHLDTDDANALGLKTGDIVKLLRK